MAIQRGGGAGAGGGEQRRARPQTNVVRGMCGHKLIHPSSPRKIVWDVLVLVCLMYTVSTLEKIAADFTSNAVPQGSVDLFNVSR